MVVFPAPVGPTMAMRLPGGRVEVQIPDDGLPGNVGEVHVLHPHIALYIRQSFRILRVRFFRLRVDEGEDPLGGGEGTLQLGEDVGQLVDGAGELPGILDEAAQIPQPELPPEEQHRAEYAQHGQGHIVDEIHRGAGDRTIGLCHGVGIHGGAVLFVKPLQNLRLPAVGPDGFPAGEHLLHKAVQLPQPGAAPPEQGPHPGCQGPGEQGGEGDGHQEDQHQPGGDGEHHAKGHAHGNHALQNL